MLIDDRPGPRADAICTPKFVEMHEGAHPVTTDDGSPPTNPSQISPSQISTQDVAKVAALARLELTPAELETFTGQLADILDHAADLSAIDLDGVEPLGTPVAMENVLRADVPGDTLDRDEVLASAPASEDGKFKVTSILGDGA